MTPHLENEDYDCKLKVMSGIVPFMRLELFGTINYYPTMLHEHTSQTNMRYITINLKSIGYC